MVLSSFQIPENWPSDARGFARDILAENHSLREAIGKMMVDIAKLQGAQAKAQEEIRELKAKLGTNSSNSHKPPSQDPPGTPPRSSEFSGRKQGAQKGHKGHGRNLFSSERVTSIRDVFPTKCPTSGVQFRPEDLISLSWRRVHQVDMPKNIVLEISEFRLHTCLCPCGCGKRLTAKMPAEAGNSVVGFRLKSVMALLATRYHLSKTMIRELLIDIFGPEATFSRGCISEAEAEMSCALKKPYEEAKSAIQKEKAVNVDETSWFLKHKIHWLWIAVSDALSVFFVDPNRSRAAFQRFLGDFKGLITSDRFSAYRHLPPETRQLCWAHLIRDFRKLVDRNGGAEKIGKWALEEIEVMFDLWRLYLDGEIDLARLQKEVSGVQEKFEELIKLGQVSQDSKAASLCKNLEDLWPSLWNFLQQPDILQPTNNRAEQGVRQPVIGRQLSLGSQSDRGLRFTERMLTMVTTLRRQGRQILAFLQEALLSHRGITSPPTLVIQPSG